MKLHKVLPVAAAAMVLALGVTAIGATAGDNRQPAPEEITPGTQIQRGFVNDNWRWRLL